jgi:hypothetical protein
MQYIFVEAAASILYTLKECNRSGVLLKDAVVAISCICILAKVQHNKTA